MIVGGEGGDVYRYALGEDAGRKQLIHAHVQSFAVSPKRSSIALAVANEGLLVASLR